MQQKKSKYKTKYEVKSCLNITIMVRTLGSETHTQGRVRPFNNLIKTALSKFYGVAETTLNQQHLPSVEASELLPLAKFQELQ
jgi:hypothetical protein